MVARLHPVDQTKFQLQPPPQTSLLTSHLAIILLMIESRQVEDSVQR
jgi:hypothetical protein